MNYINEKLIDINNNDEYEELLYINSNKKVKSSIRKLEDIIGLKQRNKYFILENNKLFILKKYINEKQKIERYFSYFYLKGEKYKTTRYNSTYIQEISGHRISSLEIENNKIVLILEDEILLIDLNKNSLKKIKIDLEKFKVKSYEEISSSILKLIAMEKLKKNYNEDEITIDKQSSLKSLLEVKNFENKIKEVINEEENN